MLLTLYYPALEKDLCDLYSPSETPDEWFSLQTSSGLSAIKSSYNKPSVWDHQSAGKTVYIDQFKKNWLIQIKL